MKEYLLYCIQCDEYTSLGRYIEKEGRFAGEYSLLFNQCMESDELLSRFLLSHVTHPLKMIMNKSDEFAEVIRSSKRFMDQDVDKFVQLSIQQKQDKAASLLMERELGRLQINIFKKLLEEEANIIAKLPTSTAAEAQFLLGKEEGIKRSLSLLEDLIQRTNEYYK